MLAPLLYPTAEAYLAAPEKSVALFGMSGLGKTHLARMLRAEGGWFHYSIDYRIGTRYLGEAIDDNLKREAMKSAFFRPLLLSDGIRISSKIAFENLAPLSTWLGKPGDAARGGLIFEDYVSRQRLHRAAEIGALCDTGHFVRRSREIYGYRNFLADTGGSICEVVEPANPDDPVMRHLSSVALPVLLRGSEADAEILAERFARNPKPIYFPEGFLLGAWTLYREAHDGPVDPDRFMVWAFRKLLPHRLPRYEAMAKHWGVAIDAKDAHGARTPADFDALVADAIARAGAEQATAEAKGEAPARAR